MKQPFSPLVKWLGITLALIGVFLFILKTPADFLRKLDYIGAAVCHRLPSHSFMVAGHQLPLCERCTGTFPGALTGLIVQWGLWRRRRSIRFPSWSMLILLSIFALLWALDGINSATASGQLCNVHRAPGAGAIGYIPQPWLRLLSGMMMGMSMSIILVPAFNQAFWSDAEDAPVIRSWRELLLLVAGELGIAGLIYLAQGSSSHFALYSIAIYSTLGVVTMFTLLGAMIFVLILQKDASLSSWHEAWVPLTWGLVFSISIIAVMDTARLWLIGTIDGIPSPP